MKSKRIACLILLLATMLTAGAQELAWSVDMSGFFDNREYSYDKVRSQTIFGTRLSPEIGIEIDNSRIMAGASWVQPIDGCTNNAKIHPTVYYRYDTPRLKMSLGMFPRTQLLETPLAIMQYDSLTYFRPNLAGALFQYVAPKGYAETYIDWRQVQTKETREAFLIAFNGRWQPHTNFFAGANLMMNHLALTRTINDKNTVTDDLIVSPYIGLDLSSNTPLSTLTLKVGYHLSLERLRNIGTWHRPQGLLIDLLAEWRFLGMRNTFYTGDAQMPFYPLLGPELNQGDPFYQSSTYNRTDIYAYLFRNNYLNCYVSCNFHYTPGNFDMQQQLILRFFINDKYKN